MSTDFVLCLKPIQIRPKSYGSHKWFPDATKIDQDKFILVPCGRCIVCMHKLCQEWSNRIQMEMDYYGGVEKCAFITLTYNEENLPEDRSVHKEILQKYIKRVRERLGGREIKYYAIGEYGELYKRPHYHIVIMGADGHDYFGQLERLKRKEKIIDTGDDWYHLHKAWHGLGYTDIQRPKSTGGVGGYVANYLSKLEKAAKDAKELGLAPPFRIMSKKLGLRTTIRLAKQFADNQDTVWPINYIERVGTDGKVYKFSLGRYLRKKLHEAAGKMGIYIAAKNLYIRRQRYSYGSTGVNFMETNHYLDKESQDQVKIKHEKAKFKLGET